MADLLRDLWPVWLFFAVLGWVSEAVSARLIYWQRQHITVARQRTTSGSDHFCPDCREWESERICPNLPADEPRTEASDG